MTKTKPMTYEAHPAAEIFPLMEGKPFEELKADIAKHGQRELIVIFEGKILDGRNRYRACQEQGIEPKLDTQRADITDPYTFVASANLHRRHLNSSQRAMIVAKFVARLKRGQNNATATMTAGEAATLAKVHRTVVGNAVVVLDHGTPEEIAVIERDGTGLNTTAASIRARNECHTADRVDILRERALLAQKIGNIGAAEKLGINLRTLQASVQEAKEMGLIQPRATILGRGLKTPEMERPTAEEMQQPDPEKPSQTIGMKWTAEHGHVQLWAPSVKEQHELVAFVKECGMRLRRMAEEAFPTEEQLARLDNQQIADKYRADLAKYLTDAIANLQDQLTPMEPHHERQRACQPCDRRAVGSGAD